MTKKNIELQPRLRRLADLVPQGARLADIGTDHGYIPAELLLEGKISTAIASDIGAEPLQHAVRTAKEHRVEDRIDFRLSDGLSAYRSGEADCYLLAGMGGETMEHILEKAPWVKSKNTLLLLQPQTKQEQLRIWLFENGYTIEREKLVLDKGTLYNIFLVRPGQAGTLSLLASYTGIGLRDDPLYPLYIKKQIQRLKIKSEGLSAGKSAAEHEIAALHTLIKALEEEI